MRWIVELDRDHSHAVVGEPSRPYLWILSRTAAMDAAAYQSLAATAERRGFDVARLVRTTQSSR